MTISYQDGQLTTIFTTRQWRAMSLTTFQWKSQATDGIWGHVYVRMKDLPEDRSEAVSAAYCVRPYVLISVLPPNHGDVELATADSEISLWLTDRIPRPVIRTKYQRQTGYCCRVESGHIVLLVGVEAFFNYGQTVLLNKLGQQIVYGFARRSSRISRI